MRKISVLAAAIAALLGLTGFIAQQTIGYDQATGSVCVYDRATTPQCVPIGKLDSSRHRFFPATAIGKSVLEYATCDGSVADDAGLAAAAASGRDLLFPASASCRLTGGAMLGAAEQRWTFEKGALLTVTSGTVNIAATIDAPASQIFAGAGTIVGPRQARPEWWPSGTPDGSTDNITAINAAVAAVQGATSTVGPQPKVLFGTGTYRYSATIIVSPNSTVPIKLEGTGSNGGTTLKALSSFTGAYGVLFSGPSTTDTGVGELMSGVRIITDVGYGPSVGLGLVGQTGHVVSSYRETGLSDVVIANFPVGIRVSNWRTTYFDRIAVWASSVTDATGIQFLVGSGSSDFTGDMTFNVPQIVLGGPGSSTAFSFYNTNSTGSYNAMAGFRIRSPIVYKATNGVYVNNSGTSNTNDIWVTDGQFDGPFGTGLTLDSNVSGGAINNVHYKGNYHTSNSGPIAYLKDSNGGKIRGVQISGNWAVGGTSNQVKVEDGSGGGAEYITGTTITGNVFSDISAGTSVSSAVVFLNSGTNTVVANNTMVKTAGISLYSAVTVGSSAVGTLVTSNNATGCDTATGWSATVTNLSGSTTAANNTP